MERKRFVLIFPEGKGLLGGWSVLAQKLRTCGVKSQFKAVVLNARALPVQRERIVGTRTDASLAKEGGVPRESEFDLVWLQLGDANAFNKLHHLISAWWGDGENPRMRPCL